MEAMETGLVVGLIATRREQFLTCTDDQEVWELRSNDTYKGIDNIPVVDGDRITGVLEPSQPAAAKVSEVKTRLDDAMLVPFSMPIGSFIRQMDGSRGFWLVAEADEPVGIVTPSDLLKLPVRLFVFALVTHLEMVMAELITSRLSVNEWLGYLDDERRQDVLGKQVDLMPDNFDPNLIELTEFCDKRDLVHHIMNFESNQFKKQVGNIERRLRNKVAHAGDYVPDQGFVKLIGQTEHWIEELSAHIHLGEERGISTDSVSQEDRTDAEPSNDR